MQRLQDCGLGNISHLYKWSNIRATSNATRFSMDVSWSAKEVVVRHLVPHLQLTLSFISTVNAQQLTQAEAQCNIALGRTRSNC